MVKPGLGTAERRHPQRCTVATGERPAGQSAPGTAQPARHGEAAALAWCQVVLFCWSGVALASSPRAEYAVAFTTVRRAGRTKATQRRPYAATGCSQSTVPSESKTPTRATPCHTGPAVADWPWPWIVVRLTGEDRVRYHADAHCGRTAVTAMQNPISPPDAWVTVARQRLLPAVPQAISPGGEPGPGRCTVTGGLPVAGDTGADPACSTTGTPAPIAATATVAAATAAIRRQARIARPLRSTASRGTGRGVTAASALSRCSARSCSSLMFMAHPIGQIGTGSQLGQRARGLALDVPNRAAKRRRNLGLGHAQPVAQQHDRPLPVRQPAKRGDQRRAVVTPVGRVGRCPVERQPSRGFGHPPLAEPVVIRVQHDLPHVG